MLMLLALLNSIHVKVDEPDIVDYEGQVYSALMISAFILPIHYYVLVPPTVAATASLIEYLDPSVAPITKPVYNAAIDATLASPIFIFSKIPSLHYAVAIPPTVATVACSITYMHLGPSWMKSLCKGSLDTTAYFVGCALLNGPSKSSPLVPAVRAGVCAVKEVVKARVTNETISPLAIATRCTPLITEYSIKAYGATGRVELLKSRAWVYTIGGAGNGITKSLISLAQGSNETVFDHMASISWTTLRVRLHELPGSYSDTKYNWIKFSTEAIARTIADAGAGEAIKRSLSVTLEGAHSIAIKAANTDMPTNSNDLPCLKLEQNNVCTADTQIDSQFPEATPLYHVTDPQVAGADQPLPKALDSL
jgi:hypothetical protein